MKILVVEDSNKDVSRLDTMLKKLHHEIATVNNENEAVNLLKLIRPDIIIIDVDMKSINGHECARHIRESEDEDWIPIIFLTTNSEDESIAKCINSGGDDYLEKPINEIDLRNKLSSMKKISEIRQRLFLTTRELQSISSVDPLTGLYNRIHFEKVLKEKISESDRYHNMITLLFIDIDNFKSINDNMGHYVGDLLLKEFSSRLKSCLRLEDFAARLGGDEFVVIFTHIEDQKSSSDIASKILKNISDTYSLDNNQVRISASIGIAFYPHPGVNYHMLIQNADIAMYHAKSQGKNNFQFYSDSLNENYRRHISLEHELKFALDRNQIILNYQPIYNLLNKKLIGMEALVRWQHPEYGSVSPNIFIPIAEETSEIYEIGAWVLDHACSQLAKWHASGCRDFRMSVNVSLHQFMQDEFYELVLETLNKYHIPPKMLELELTESTAITYTNYLITTINKINNLGVGISVDDFGTRYSSLTSLKHLPITTLKIDKSFMKDINTDMKNAVIVKSLIALANSLNLNVVAEGVQNEEQLEFLVLNGCDFGQGFLLGKPLTTDEMSNLLLQNEIIGVLPEKTTKSK